jgi:hypothetical protein
MQRLLSYACLFAVLSVSVSALEKECPVGNLDANYTRAALAELAETCGGCPGRADALKSPGWTTGLFIHIHISCVCRLSLSRPAKSVSTPLHYLTMSCMRHSIPACPIPCPIRCPACPIQCPGFNVLHAPVNVPGMPHTMPCRECDSNKSSV